MNPFNSRPVKQTFPGRSATVSLGWPQPKASRTTQGTALNGTGGAAGFFERHAAALSNSQTISPSTPQPLNPSNSQPINPTKTGSSQPPKVAPNQPLHFPPKALNHSTFQPFKTAAPQQTKASAPQPPTFSTAPLLQKKSSQSNLQPRALNATAPVSTSGGIFLASEVLSSNPGFFEEAKAAGERTRGGNPLWARPPADKQGVPFSPKLFPSSADNQHSSDGSRTSVGNVIGFSELVGSKNVLESFPDFPSSGDLDRNRNQHKNSKNNQKSYGFGPIKKSPELKSIANPPAPQSLSLPTPQPLNASTPQPSKIPPPQPINLPLPLFSQPPETNSIGIIKGFSSNQSDSDFALPIFQAPEPRKITFQNPPPVPLQPIQLNHLQSSPNLPAPQPFNKQPSLTSMVPKENFKFGFAEIRFNEPKKNQQPPPTTKPQIQTSDSFYDKAVPTITFQNPNNIPPPKPIAYQTPQPLNTSPPPPLNPTTSPKIANPPQPITLTTPQPYQSPYSYPYEPVQDPKLNRPKETPIINFEMLFEPSPSRPHPTLKSSAFSKTAEFAPIENPPVQRPLI